VRALVVNTVWVDGRLGSADEVRLSPFDHAVTVGDGVFETLKVVDGTPFAMRRHLRRLRSSAEVLGLDIGRSDDELRAASEAVIAATAGAGRLRITVTGGEGPLGSGRGEGGATLVVAAAPATPWPATSRVVIVPWVRNERSAIAGAKTVSYAENVVALARAHTDGADEAIFANTVGALCEGTGTNVFVVRGERILTPSLDTGCLAGITRELVLELVDVEERSSLTLDDLRGADEAFLTSSTRDVHPIETVDGVRLASVAGPCTTAAADALLALRAKDVDP
jgi:branched-chain amino acid aminotransferase